MIKNIFSLAIQGMRRRKRQSLLIFAVLTISFAFAIMLLSYSSSISSTNSQLYTDTFGTWYASFISEDETADREYLESNDWLDDIGVSVNYGSISIISELEGLYDNLSFAGNYLSLGTVDDSLVDMGIQMQSGRMPNKSGEIAVESSMLSTLGLGSSLGQKVQLIVTFTADERSFETTQEFTLVGVISSYTSIWSVNGTLNNVIVTEECIEELWNDAISSVYEGYRDMLEYTTDVTMFFSVNEGMEKNVQSKVSSYLVSNHSSTRTRKLSVNTKVELDEENTEVNTFYVWLILAVTLLAVVIIYVLQMQAEVKRIVRMRSLGGSKGQLRLLIFVETMILCIPAMILGAALGCLGLWGLLRISTYTGSTSIIINIPWNYLLISAGLWIAGVLIIRMITFQIALSTPLTGRMVMQRRKSKFYMRFRHALVMLMSIVLCVSVVFTTFSLAKPLYNYNDWASRWSYYIWTDNWLPSDGQITDELMSAVASVEGINDVDGLANFYAQITSDSGESEYMSVFVIDSDELADYADLSKIDTEAYDNGETIIIQYMDDENAMWYYQANYYSGIEFPEISLKGYNADERFETGETVTVSINYRDSFYNSLPDSVDPESESAININTVIGNIEEIEPGQKIYKLPDVLASRNYTYSTTEEGYSVFSYNGNDYSFIDYDSPLVLCSKAFLQRFVDELPDGTSWELSRLQATVELENDSDVEYTFAYVFADANANFYATDAAITNIVKDNENLSMVNRREYISSNTQVYLQSVITLLVSGICIALVVLLILLTTLRLEAESERRHYGILQALGMSKRQRNLEIMRKSAVRGIVSVVASVVCYIAYYLIINASLLAEGTSPITVIGTLFDTLAVYGLTAPVIALILLALFLVIFLICFISKLGLNKLHIMDMLNTES
ncbi:MAG: ABC transporter permease [Oscillospiraceae bacterium]|nr:ABC transporter permease [Oscillospiraceae bacterium]